jgi:hypothetical protein
LAHSLYVYTVLEGLCTYGCERNNKNNNKDVALHECCSGLQRAIHRLSLLDSHDALVLLRSCFRAPKILFLLRCSPCFGNPTLEVFDKFLKAGLTSITNTEVQGIQTSLPLRVGGIGVWRVASLEISAYLASAASTLERQRSMLALSYALSDSHADEYTTAYSDNFGHPPLLPAAGKHRAWDYRCRLICLGRCLGTSWTDRKPGT